jgi:hypothetical protein
MFERCIFMVALIGHRESPVKRLFQITREGRHGRLSLLFHNALQRVLMFPGEIHDHGDLGFRNFVSEYAALADTMLMHMHHDAARFIGILVKKSHQDVGHKFHRRVIIVQQENAIHARLLRLGFGAGDHSRPGTIVPGIALAGLARGTKRRQGHPAPAYPDPNRKLADRHFVLVLNPSLLVM